MFSDRDGAAIVYLLPGLPSAPSAQSLDEAAPVPTDVPILLPTVVSALAAYQLTTKCCTVRSTECSADMSDLIAT